jgi:predicted Zn finger-like uncharacterized protein
MRIACPSCAAEYDVPASRIPGQRKVRCARCGNEWLTLREPAAEIPRPEVEQPLSTEPPPSPAPSRPVVTAMDRLAASAPRESSHATLIGAWALSLVILIAMALAAIVFRDDIIQIWPPSSRVLTPSGHTMTIPEQNVGKKSE